MKILLVRLGSLGDVVLTLAATHALRVHLPDAHVTYLVKAEWKALVEDQSGVDAVWTLEPGPGRGAAEVNTLRRRIRDQRFAVAVDWQTSPRSRALLAGQPRVLRWRAERWLRRRHVTFRWTRPAPVRPAWLRYADALAPLGVEATGLAPPHYVPPVAAHERAAAFHAAWDAAAGDGPVLALAPGARWATKRWPAALFAAVAARARERGERVLWVGDADDRLRFAAEAGDAAREREEDPGTRWFTGDLPATAAALVRARAVVANDSGLLHLAAAVGRPVVGIYASTAPVLGFPPAVAAGDGDAALVLSRGLACQPCTLHGRERCPLGHHRCAREIGPADVEGALARLARPLAG